MIKNGKFLQCTYCEKQALPDTEPPVCEEHNKLQKKASDKPKTLKELDAPYSVSDEAANDSGLHISVRGDLAPADPV